MAKHQDLVVSFVFCNFALLQISDFPTNAPWAELIVNIQYACQRHFFGAMADNYFDNKNREASANFRHNPKTVEAFNRLPEVFTKEDVMRCFSLRSDSAAGMRISRLIKDRVVVKLPGFVENGTTKGRFKKTGVVMLS